MLIKFIIISFFIFGLYHYITLVFRRHKRIVNLMIFCGILMFIGYSLNVIASVSNGGKMPVYIEEQYLNNFEPIEQWNKHIYVDSSKKANYPLLIDRYYLKGLAVISIGDMIIYWILLTTLFGVWQGVFNEIIRIYKENKDRGILDEK